jgi:hypothetical protein
MTQGSIIGLTALFATLAVPVPARCEEQLPIDELFPCEVVLHELIAELGKYRTEAKRLWADDNAKNDREHQLSDEVAVQTWDKAITITKRKFSRCPY